MVLHKFLHRQSHCNTVCYYNSLGSKLQRYCTILNLFPNEVWLNIDKLGVGMGFRIVHKCDSSLVICKVRDYRELLELAIQNQTEKEAKTNCFL